MHDTLHTQSISFDYVPLVCSSLGNDNHHDDYKAEALHDGDDHDDDDQDKAEVLHTRSVPFASPVCI